MTISAKCCRCKRPIYNIYLQEEGYCSECHKINSRVKGKLLVHERGLYTDK